MQKKATGAETDYSYRAPHFTKPFHIYMPLNFIQTVPDYDTHTASQRMYRTPVGLKSEELGLKTILETMLSAGFENKHKSPVCGLWSGILHFCCGKYINTAEEGDYSVYNSRSHLSSGGSQGKNPSS